LGTRRKREVISDRGTRDLHSTEECMPPDAAEFILAHLLREIVARELRSIAPLLRAVIDETLHGHLLIRRRVGREELTEAIGGEAKSEPRPTLPIERLNRPKGAECGESGPGASQVKKTSAGEQRHRM